jgi:dipeptidyl aminopeptidase/acylaminoacyl peptidase
VAYVSSGALHVVDVATCRDRVLVGSGASPPVAFSPSGDWIAFGGASVVSVAGGPVVRPLGGPASAWEWSPTADALAGVTALGGLGLGGPLGAPTRLYPDGSGVREARFSPDGSQLAVDVDLRRITVFSAPSVARHTAYRIPTGSVAGLQVAGWSPDGRWILHWLNAEHSSSIAADGLPLEAVLAAGGSPVQVTDRMLLYPDFLTPCGRTMVASVGGDRFVTAGKRLVAVGPPTWEPVDVSADPNRSWFWPSCSPDGRWVAATATPNADERRFGTADRTIWLLATDGSSRRLLIGAEGDAVADEAPRWSGDGDWLLFVERDRRSAAPGTLMLARLSGTGATVVGPVATLPGEVGYYGHYDWNSVSDWYQPAP